MRSCPLSPEKTESREPLHVHMEMGQNHLKPQHPPCSELHQHQVGRARVSSPGATSSQNGRRLPVLASGGSC